MCCARVDVRWFVRERTVVVSERGVVVSERWVVVSEGGVSRE